MKWRLRDLGPGNQEKLTLVFRDRGLPETLGYFEDRGHGKVISWAGGLAMVLAAVGAEILWEMANSQFNAVNVSVVGGLTALLLFWGSLAFLEVLRTRRSAVKPFLLVTPEFVVHCDESYGIVYGYRLAEATKFRASEKYSAYQKYVGREYDIAFSEDHVVLLARSRQQIDLAEQVFAEARAGRSLRTNFLEGFPNPDATAKSSNLREFTHPLGIFWQGLIAIIALGFLILMIADQIFHRWLH